MTNTNYNHKKQQKTSGRIAAYLEAKYFRQSFPGRIIGGVMEVFYGNEWISSSEFDKLVPRVIVPDFNVNMENVDTTRLWIHK